MILLGGVMRRVFMAQRLAAVAAVYPFTVSGRSRLRPPEVTFAKDVAPIVYANCAYCHRPGEVAPFSLLTYKDARPWARAIKQQVVQRQMPPWNADPHYGELPRTLAA